ncbi:unnamed protein product, partial [Discosporangium mesarthrocarpum]
EGVEEGVVDARVWARVVATVVVPPGSLGVLLDNRVKDRPVVKEILGQRELETPPSDAPPARTRKRDQAMRLLGIKPKHPPQTPSPAEPGGAQQAGADWGPTVWGGTVG